METPATATQPEAGGEATTFTARPTAPETYGSWRPQKYFKVKSPLSNRLKLFVSTGMFVKRFGANEKTVRNGISKFMQGKSQYYQCFLDGDAIMVDYDTLPNNIKSKLKLPADAKAAYDLLRAEYEMQENINRDVEFKTLRNSLEDLYHNRWPPFLKHYEEKILDPEERILYAKSHSVIQGVIDAHRERWASKLIYEAYRQIMCNELDALSEPVFFTVSPVYFWRKIADCKSFGIPNTITHGSIGVPREYAVVVTGQIKAFARLKFRDERRYTIAAIVKMIEDKYHVTVSKSSLKKIKKKNKDRQVLEFDSNGKEWSRQNGLPKITRFLAEAPGEQFQGDFYKLQFFCRHSTGRIIRLWAYVVLDVFSRKMVGWALAEDPSAEQALESFRMAFVENSILCEEIIVDNDPLYGKVFKRFFRRLNNLGVITTKAFPHIPTWKAEIESSFAVFQKLHSSKPWFIGEDVKSQRNKRAGNPSDELRDRLYRDKANMLTEPEMRKEFAKMVQEYNAMTNDRKKKTSPQDTYRLTKSKRTIKLEEWMEPLLFWKAKTKKRIKDDGRIDLQIDNVEYTYQATEAEMLWTHKNSDVRMCYNREDMSKVHIFERGTLKYIGAIEPRMVMNRGNKEEVLRRQKRILREAQQYIRDERQKDEDIVNGTATGRKPVSREKLADKQIRRRMREQKLRDKVASVKVHR
ncbi:MAG TPA: transposase family protein [Cyclobacteriaceae bacterium]|jgi:hypothetical protein|nr:transposase family protein [Cyclobacteriaceae bacterium]